MLADIANEQAKTNRVTVIIGNDLTDDSVLGRINNRVDVKLLRRPPGSRNPRRPASGSEIRHPAVGRQPAGGPARQVRSGRPDR